MEVTKSLARRDRDRSSSKTKTQFAPKPGLVQCKNCSRNFAKERIEVHTNICKKTKNKKRKPFDAAKVKTFHSSLLSIVKF